MKSPPTAFSARLLERSRKWWLPDDVLIVEELPHSAAGRLNRLALQVQYQDYLMEKAKAGA